LAVSWEQEKGQELRAAGPVFVEYGRLACDSDQSSTLWFDVPSNIPKECHTGKLLPWPRLIFDVGRSLYGFWDDGCASCSDEKNWAVLPLVQQMPSPAIQVEEERGVPQRRHD